MIPASPVLVVDDDPGIRELIEELLTDEGYAVVAAANGAEAVQMVDKADPWLVLLDMRMPVLDGWGFVRELQSRPQLPPIIVLSAARSAEAWAAEVDAVGWLAKPFDLSDLLQLVEERAEAQLGESKEAVDPLIPKAALANSH